MPSAVTVLERGSVRPLKEVELFGLLGATSAEQRAVFVEDTLGPLMRLPGQQRRPLLDTMRALFENGGSAAAAARVLCMHPKTVQYRTGRVAELTGLSWRDPPARPRLALPPHLVRPTDS